MFLTALRPEISQGDVFEDLEVRADFTGVDGPVRTAAVLLSHDCEFDKAQQVLVAWVFPAESLPRDAVGNLVKNRVFNAFYLFPDHGRAAEFVNFRYIHPVEKARLVQADAAGGRKASMDDEARNALRANLFRFWTRSLPPIPRFGVVGRALIGIVDNVVSWLEPGERLHE